MPIQKLEIDLNDNGSPIGTLPDVFQAWVNKKIEEGKAEVATSSKAAMEAAVAKAAEAARVEALKNNPDPAASEKVKNLQVELSKMQEADALRTKNYEEAQRLRDERAADEKAEILKREAAIRAEVDRRDAVIRSAVIGKQIQIEAQQAGARKESMVEIGDLLERYVSVDPDHDFAPVINTQAFTARFPDSKLGTDGKPVSIGLLVQEYLALHQHHKAPPAGKGGYATGGRSLTGTPGSGKDAELAAAQDAVTADPSLANAAAFMARIGKRTA